MKIEEGKYYRTRDGKKVGPAEYASGDKFEFPGSWMFCHAADGKFLGNREVAHDLDIVAEWTDEPTGPVQMRPTVVPGIYGAVQVANVYADGVNIHANPGKWYAADLRAAATVLTQLADALESGAS